MLVDRFLEDRARACGDRIALSCGARRLSYAQLNADVTRFTGGLQACNVAAGDRVVIQLENSVEAVIAFFGAIRAAAVAVPLSPSVKAGKLAYIVDDCEPAVVVTERQRAGELAAAGAVRRMPGLIVLADAAASSDAQGVPGAHDFDALLGESDDLAIRRSTIDLDLAALIYTSGSTGRPKGVMLTHSNMVAAAESIDGYLRNTADDVILNVLPLSFDYGLYQTLLAFKAGARLVLERSFVYPSRLLDLIAREQVTALPVVPMIAALLLRQDLDAFDLSSLRYITNTGAGLLPAHIARLRTHLPAVRIFSMYGLTECKRVSYLAPEEVDARPTSVGKPMDNVEVYVVDEHGQWLTSGVGELVVRGRNVMRAYWRADEETARVLRPGLLPGEQVLHTGDLFRIDADGYLYFEGRLDDVIKSRGQKVSPREIEDVLHAVPGVCEALVVGLPDPILGQAVKGYVTLNEGATTTTADLLRHCAAHLEDYMVPQSVDVVSELPHNSSGKLARRTLQPLATAS